MSAPKPTKEPCAKCGLPAEWHTRQYYPAAFDHNRISPDAWQIGLHAYVPPPRASGGEE